MSDKTDDLARCLLSDIDVYFDDYQLSVLLTGGNSWPDITVKQMQCFSLYRSLLKKYNEQDQPSKEACVSALDKFLASNKMCGSWELCLENSSDEVLLGGVKDALWKFWNESGYALFSTWDELYSRGSLGKGMNIYANGDDLYTKLFDGRLTCTSLTLQFVWEKLGSRDPRWLTAERQRAERYGTHLVAGNKLSFVNKNVTVARSICTEPTINMWCQLGMGAYLEDRLASFFGINLGRPGGSNQPTQPEINGSLAREGSLTGRYSTIDLESASDSISMRMLKEILPADMLEWLVRLRSPFCQLPNKESVKLDMVSSMGNGFTFPLQTAIFSAVVASVYSARGYSLKRYGRAEKRNFGVFGDDIIVLSELAPLVIRVLGLLGFRVNAGKTFIVGPFRESCGQDYFHGHWCRGVYIKSLNTTQDAYVAINGLNRWSALTGIPLRNTVQYLHAWCHRVIYVPPYEADDSGVRVPLDPVRGKVHHLGHGLISYQASRAVPKFLRISRDGDTIMCDKGVKKRLVNPSGLLLCFLHGSVRSLNKTSQGYRIDLRQRKVRYTTKRRVTSYWDTLPPDSQLIEAGWRPWSRAVLGNLFPED